MIWWKSQKSWSRNWDWTFLSSKMSFVWLLFVNWDCTDLGKVGRSGVGKKWLQNPGFNDFLYFFCRNGEFWSKTFQKIQFWWKDLRYLFLIHEIRWKLSNFSHKSSILTKILLGNLYWCLLIITRVSNDDSKSGLKTKIRRLYAEIFWNLWDNPCKVKNSKMLQNTNNDPKWTCFNKIG